MRRHAARIASIVACLVAMALVNGCAVWRPASAPLRTIADAAPCPGPVDTLVVLLPGSYSDPEDFVREGFVRTLRQRRAAADVVMVDAHVGYYQNRSIVTRLADDVVRPARAKGYRHIWLAGISIGAVGAMLYADAHPDDVGGVVLLAPYLGTRLAAQEIRRAGGLVAWTASPPTSDADADPDVDALLWGWLQRQVTPGAAPAPKPLYLGYGRDDRFVFNDEVLAQALPASRVFTAPGGHDWPAWRPLWREIVDVLPIATDPGCRAP